MGTQAVLLPPNEKQSLWPESHSRDGAAVCELTTRISKMLGAEFMGVFVFDWGISCWLLWKQGLVPLCFSHV